MYVKLAILLLSLCLFRLSPHYVLDGNISRPLTLPTTANTNNVVYITEPLLPFFLNVKKQGEIEEIYTEINIPLRVLA